MSETPEFLQREKYCHYVHVVAAFALDLRQDDRIEILLLRSIALEAVCRPLLGRREVVLPVFAISVMEEQFEAGPFPKPVTASLPLKVWKGDGFAPVDAVAQHESPIIEFGPANTDGFHIAGCKVSMMDKLVRLQAHSLVLGARRI